MSELMRLYKEAVNVDPWTPLNMWSNFVDRSTQDVLDSQHSTVTAQAKQVYMQSYYGGGGYGGYSGGDDFYSYNSFEAVPVAAYAMPMMASRSDMPEMGMAMAEDESADVSMKAKSAAA